MRDSLVNRKKRGSFVLLVLSPLTLDIKISFAARSSLDDTVVKHIMKQRANIKDMWDVNRIKIQAMSDLKMTTNAVARKLKMHTKSVSKILQQIRIRGDTKRAHKVNPGATKATPQNVRTLKEMVRKQPVRNLRHITEALGISNTTACKLIKLTWLKSLATIIQQNQGKNASRARQYCCSSSSPSRRSREGQNVSSCGLTK